MLLDELHTSERESGGSCPAERGGDTALKCVAEGCRSGIE